MLSGEAERQCDLTRDDIIKKSSVPCVAVMEGLTGVTLDDIIDSLPKGSTPNRYKPHQSRQ